MSKGSEDFRLVAVVLVLVLVRLVIGGAPKEAQASTSCGSQGNYFDGETYYATPADPAVRGARADIEILNTDLCISGADTAALVWSMVAGEASGDGWAQVGLIRKNYGAAFLRFFWQYRRCSRTGCEANVTAIYGSPCYTCFYTFRVSMVSNNHLKMFIDSQQADPNADGQQAETNFNPLTEWSALRADWQGETLHPGDDMPGTGGSRNDFTGVERMRPNGSWIPPDDLQLLSTYCFYKNNEVSASHFNIWTNPLDHSC